MAGNPHFATVSSPEEAEAWIGFVPRLPAFTAGFDLMTIAIFVKDHEMRDVPMEQRSVELHYGGFVVSQAQPGPEEARRQALDVRYGRVSRAGQILGRDARIYQLGPAPVLDDIDPGSPAVVVWADGERFVLVASDELEAETLIDIAMSIYR